MAVSALTNFALSHHPYTNHIPKFSHSTIRNSCKPHNVSSSSSSSSSLCYHRQQPVGKLHVSPKPLLLALPSPTQKNIAKFLVEKIATAILGSLIFMGCLKPRPVLACPCILSENFDGNRGSQSKSIDDEKEEVRCMKLLERDPDNIKALKMVVKVKMRRGKAGEAAKYVKRLIELQPDEMKWRMLQASCYEIMGRLSKARSVLQQILKRKPLLVGALRGLAMVMHKNHEGPAVIEMLERALKVARKKGRANLERNIRILVAQMHCMKGELEVAKEKFQALIDEDPMDFRLHVCQGYIYTMMNKRKKAAKYFEMYRSLVPKEHHLKKILDDAVGFAQNGTR